MSRRTRTTFRPRLETIERRELMTNLAGAIQAAAIHAEHHHHHHQPPPPPQHEHPQPPGGGSHLTVLRVAITPLNPLPPATCFFVNDDIGNSGDFHWGPGTTQFFFTTGRALFLSVNSVTRQIPSTSTGNIVPNYGVTATPNGPVFTLLGNTTWKNFSIPC